MNFTIYKQSVLIGAKMYVLLFLIMWLFPTLSPVLGFVIAFAIVGFFTLRQ